MATSAAPPTASSGKAVYPKVDFTSIESKEDLFLHVVRKGYGALYDHIAVERKSDAQHGDILECFRLAAEAALHFYLDNPQSFALSHLWLILPIRT